MLFVIQLIDERGFNKMMGGELDYSVIEKQFIADSKEEAIKAAERQFPNHIINENFVLTLQEWQDFTSKRSEMVERTRRRDAEKKAKRALRELDNANALGLTVAEYRTMKRRQATCRKYHREIEKLQAQIAEMQAYIDTYEQRP